MGAFLKEKSKDSKIVISRQRHGNNFLIGYTYQNTYKAAIEPDRKILTDW
jgi:hypothetical protein